MMHNPYIYNFQERVPHLCLFNTANGTWIYSGSRSYNNAGSVLSCLLQFAGVLFVANLWLVDPVSGDDEGHS